MGEEEQLMLRVFRKVDCARGYGFTGRYTGKGWSEFKTIAETTVSY
jgi:hypothetical protein